MCAGDHGAFESVRPLLDALGENVFHLGALGSGHTVKLINNYFGMTVACGMAEAFAMADASGVGRREVFDVMAAGPNHSAMMDFIGNTPPRARTASASRSPTPPRISATTAGWRRISGFPASCRSAPTPL